MLRRMAPLLNFRQAEEILKLISTKICNEDPAENPFYYAPNLLLLCVHIYEIAHIFERQYDFLSGIAQFIKDKCIRVGSNYVETISDEEQLRALVFDRDLENRDSLALLSKYNITGIMNNRNMEKIALELWTS